jgi:hypothetical protein
LFQQLVKLLRIRTAATFEADIEMASILNNIGIGVNLVLAFVVALTYGEIAARIRFVSYNCAINLGNTASPPSKSVLGRRTLPKEAYYPL